MGQTLLGEVREEFDGADIPDWRLRERLAVIAQEMEEAPEASLPKALKTAAAREAAYRFLGNAKVSLAAILAPHFRATERRCRRFQGQVYAVSDSSEFSFSGPERGKRLGRLQGKSRGFIGHATLAVSDDGTPLGLLGLDVLVRPDEQKQRRNIYQRKKDPKRESLRWAAMVEKTSALMEGWQAIHVMDSEADMYELLTQMQRGGHRFIVRSGQDRLVDEGIHLEEAIQGAQTVVTREVVLSRRAGPRRPGVSRRNGPRAGRQARLQVSAMRLALRRPKTCTVEYPSSLELNVVVVRETDPPEGEQPVEWILFTSEAIDTAAAVAAVVDGYRRRWLIEEYFKAIKTGCNYENRELESLRTLTNMLGIVAVIAWRLLLLRAIERDNSQASAADVVDPQLLDALAARLRDIKEPNPLPPHPTVAEFLVGIARLGGHITSNGRPGWQVLWRGYQDLITWGGGYIFRASSTTYRDQS